MSLPSVTLLIALLLKETSSNFACKSVDGPLSPGTDDGNSAVSCPTSHPVMVSCGHRMRYSSSNSDGSWMSDDGTVCNAQNGENDNGGVYAVARYVHIQKTNLYQFQKFLSIQMLQI